MKKELKKSLCVFLIICFIANIFSVGATQENETKKDDFSEGEPNNLLFEIESMRNEYSKVFKMSDGNNIAYVFNSPIHYQSDGNWEEIDNRLTLNEEKGVYENTSNSFMVELPKVLDTNNYVSVAKDDYSVSFNLLSQNSTSEMQQERTLENEAMLQDVIDSSKVISNTYYENVFDNTNIQYSVENRSIKENIILKRKPANKIEYEYELFCGNLTPFIEDDNSISFYNNDNEKEFYMPPMYMFDEKQEYSADIQLNLLSVNDQKYHLTITPSYEWLNDKNRKYPVTIDPTISEQGTYINDTYISSVSPDTNYSDSNSFKIGSTSIALIKGNAIDWIGEGAVIEKVLLHLKKNNPSGNSSDVRAYEINSAWNPSAVTWNTRPSISNTVIDSSDMHDNTYASLDISEYYRKNMTEGNGIALKCDQDVSIYSEDFGSADYCPFITIEFKSTCGINTAYPTREYDMGKAGKVYLNDYTGKLSLKRTDMYVSGELAPVNISMVYDMENPFAGRQFAPGSAVNYLQTNYNTPLRVSEYSGRNYHYTLYNENGNILYFYETFKTDSTDPVYYYVDTENIGYRLERYTHIDHTLYYYLYDINDDVYSYDSYGRLTFIKYKNNNQYINITYQSDSIYYIDYVTDGAGRKFKYNYTSNPLAPSEKLISSIYFYGKNDLNSNLIDKIVSYNYDNYGRLINVTYDNEGSVSYTYNDSHYLTSITNIDGRKLGISYNNGKVSQICEMNGSTVVGDTLSIDYEFKKTTFTNFKGRKQIEHFDQYGTLSFVFDENNNIVTLDTSKKESGLMPASEVKSFVTNKISNSSFEQGSTGFSVSTRPTTSFNFNWNETHTGNNALKITSTVNDPAYNAVYKSIGIVQEKSLLFSAWVKTEPNTSIDIMLGFSRNYKSTGFVSTNDEWKQIWITNDFAEVSGNTVYIYISTQGQGSVLIDDLQLSKGTESFLYNAVQNSDFSNADNSWVLSSEVHIDAVQNRFKNYYLPEGTSVKATGSLVENTATQRIYLNDKKGSIYLFGGWGYSNDALPPPSSASQAERLFGIKVKVYHPSDPSKNAEFFSAFNPYINSLQNIESSFSLPFDCEYIDISFVFKGQHGTANFIAANVQKSIDASERTPEEEPENEDNTTEVKNSLGQVVSRTHENGLKEDYEYNDKNLMTSSKATYNGIYLQATNTYSSDGNLITGTNDMNRISETATYDLNNSRILTRDNVSYTYDNAGRVTELSQWASGGGTLPHTSKISLDYSNGHQNIITKYNYNNEPSSYELLYNLYGDITQLKAGGKVLTNYNYDSITHKLTSVQYPGYSNIQFLYNTTGLLTNIQESNVTKYKYNYDDVGSLYSIEDKVNNIQITYKNNLIEYNRVNDQTIFRYGKSSTDSSLTYEMNNRVVAQNYDINKEESYAKTTIQDGLYTYSKKTDYDVFGRKTGSKYSKDANPPFYTTQQSYYTETSGRTTKLISNQTFEYQNVPKVQLEYNYDEQGRITSVKENGASLQAYTYDSIGQLSSYRVPGLNQRVEMVNFETDNQGVKVIYDATSGDYLKQVLYQYDSNWVDQLIGYDDKSITYDNIGNMTSYDGKYYYWNMGHSLTTILGSGTDLSYSYDVFGNLIKKTDNGNDTNYYWIGDKLCSEEIPGYYSIHYRYDADGLPMSLNYGGQEYYYMVNALHDVIGIIDSSGNVVVKYSYDPFGQIVSMTGSMANTLGVRNSLRYKSYFYDSSSGFYWLKSRFYNPEWGRFISPDTVLDATGTATANLYNYCNSDPVNNTDPGGNYSFSILNQQLTREGFQYYSYSQDDFYPGENDNFDVTEIATNFCISSPGNGRFNEFVASVVGKASVMQNPSFWSVLGSIGSTVLTLMSKKEPEKLHQFISTTLSALGISLTPKQVLLVIAITTTVIATGKYAISNADVNDMKATADFLTSIKENETYQTSPGLGNYATIRMLWNPYYNYQMTVKITDPFGAGTTSYHFKTYPKTIRPATMMHLINSINQVNGYLVRRRVNQNYKLF